MKTKHCSKADQITKKDLKMRKKAQECARNAKKYVENGRMEKNELPTWNPEPETGIGGCKGCFTITETTQTFTKIVTLG